VICMGGKDKIRGQEELQKTVLDTNLCTECGTCINLCPYFKSYRGTTTISAIIYFALRKGYLDGAVLTDREVLLPVPRFITNPEDVFTCASSKYTAAPTLSALNQGIRDGFKQIGIVATPCQALAMGLMRFNLLEDHDFVD
jgi:coenzyme F420-reducing hydrogenase beta subunit